jgi:hypothetical protein
MAAKVADSDSKITAIIQYSHQHSRTRIRTKPNVDNVQAGLPPDTSYSLRTMVMTSGDPEWSVKLPDRRWIYARAGRINIGSGTTSLKEEEKAAFASAERTALRWGIPAAQPKGGACRDCTSFVRVDGDSHLLDYGVCIADAGPFDGRAVNLDSGCPSFCGRE